MSWIASGMANASRPESDDPPGLRGYACMKPIIVWSRQNPCLSLVRLRLFAPTIDLKTGRGRGPKSFKTLPRVEAEEPAL